MSQKYHEHQFFEPERGLGSDKDRCHHCGHNVMDHYNSRCPLDDEETDKTADELA